MRAICGLNLHISRLRSLFPHPWTILLLGSFIALGSKPKHFFSKNHHLYCLMLTVAFNRIFVLFNRVLSRDDCLNIVAIGLDPLGPCLQVCLCHAPFATRVLAIVVCFGNNCMLDKDKYFRTKPNKTQGLFRGLHWLDKTTPWVVRPEMDKKSCLRPSLLEKKCFPSLPVLIDTCLVTPNSLLQWHQ